jgi:hypothetical protein
MVKRMGFKRRSDRVAPYVSKVNQIRRLTYVLNKLIELPDGSYVFKGMYYYFDF